MEGKPNDLLARIAGDTAFMLDEEAISRTLRPEAYIGCAAMQAEDYLQGEAGEILARYVDIDMPQGSVSV
jgi:adenylosuccinate lyase